MENKFSIFVFNVYTIIMLLHLTKSGNKIM